MADNPLTYRETVSTDTQLLTSCDGPLDKELEEAVRFLHNNGILFHYEDPLLNNLYFVDPQWLCDMLARIVRIREFGPLIRDGELTTIIRASYPLYCDYPYRCDAYC